MRFATTLVSFALAAVTGTHALPTSLESRAFLGSALNVLNDAIVFDAAAFPDPANPGNTLVGLQSFVSVRQIDFGLLDTLIDALDIPIGDSIQTVRDRLKIFAAVGVSGKAVELDVPGCSQTAVLPATGGFPDLGMGLQNVSLGACNTARQLTGQVRLSSLDRRTITTTIFNSPDSGFGVISDVDDTIKISNVLDKLALAKSTLLEAPKFVPGMPDLYSSLSRSLNDPQFIYISGSPFQLYPLLRDFIGTNFPQARGPLLLQNLTLINPQTLLDFAGGDGVETYKISMIDRVKGMYPNKRFLTIGDSTQRDPEIYAEAFAKYGDSIACIWIREVPGADNSQARFDAAFAGVPQGRFRRFTDADIPSLQGIDVAGGQC
ncbi:hypothetical protein AX16_006799 [Volvariella volvacea WC 439]|nr:hypothetical protein AX16_006799 [Volvariella volvacea WC 439]